jgi:hypothetical protein
MIEVSREQYVETAKRLFEASLDFNGESQGYRCMRVDPSYLRVGGDVHDGYMVGGDPSKRYIKLLRSKSWYSHGERKKNLFILWEETLEDTREFLDSIDPYKFSSSVEMVGVFCEDGEFPKDYDYVHESVHGDVLEPHAIACRFNDSPSAKDNLYYVTSFVDRALIDPESPDREGLHGARQDR